MCILPFDQSRVCPAHLLGPLARLRLALDALGGRPVSRLASEHLVSRKFVYRQLRKAQAGLDLAFDPPDQPDGLLFWLPVTRPWLRQLVLALALDCHGSYRGIIELFADLFDLDISVGTVHNILASAACAAGSINAQQDPSAVRFAALDEIFQAGSPVLVAALGGNAAQREQAAGELGLGGAIEPYLREMSGSAGSAEVRGRVKDILERLKSRPTSGERLRALRAIEVLEHVGSPEARRLLRRLADGQPQAATRAAKAALERPDGGRE